jgi:formylglycine-generating enzyme required for sulfatase activity
LPVSAGRPQAARACLPAIGALLLAALLLAGCGKADQPPPAATAAGPLPTVTTRTGVEMVLVPAGEFVMGDDGGDDDERPAHKVRISAFYIDTSEVTQKAYRALMGGNPAKFAGPDRPVERASWLAATQYCNMRSLREGLKPCYDPKTQACDFAADGYRLPTEAEWEYACRAGTATRYSFGNDAAGLPAYAWFRANAAKETHPARQRAPNPWGLYDMHGNVAEWCNDFYADAYTAGEATDPRGPAGGKERVLRGGSWASSAEACRSSSRAAEPPGFADVCFGYEAYGFRCVRRAPAQAAAAAR